MSAKRRLKTHIDRAKAALKTTYKVTVQVTMDDIPKIQHEFPVQEYTSKRAKRKAVMMMADKLEAVAIDCHVAKGK